MATRPIADYRDPLDLLHRFVPAPLTACLHLDCASVILQTNDVRFLSSTELRDFPDAARMDNQPYPSCLWKIIRDTDVSQELAEATTILSDDLVVYSRGPACIVAADRARSEVLAFIGASVDVRAYQHIVLPTLCRLTEFVTGSNFTIVAHADFPSAAGDQCNA